MERRHFTRTRLRLPVQIFIRDRFVGRYETRDIDLEGVFIESHACDLAPNDLVELAFLRADGTRFEYILNAGVVRRTADGVGLMLFDNGARALAIIADAMAASRRNAHRKSLEPC